MAFMRRNLLVAADAVQRAGEGEAVARAFAGGAGARARRAAVGRVVVAVATAEVEVVAAEPGRAAGLLEPVAGVARHAAGRDRHQAHADAADVVGRREPALAPAGAHVLRDRIAAVVVGAGVQRLDAAVGHARGARRREEGAGLPR